MPDVTFFATPADFRAWLDEHHATESELSVGFYKKATGRPSITWSESVDEALCVGWIDGVRHRIDEESYRIRFTPRKAKGIWSAVNLAKVEELTRQGRMREAGVRAFEQRGREAVYAYEQKTEPRLDEEFEALLRADAAAYDFFQRQPPWYRRTATHWVTRAKKEETRRRRLATLIDDSRAGRTIANLTRPGKKE